MAKKGGKARRGPSSGAGPENVNPGLRQFIVPIESLREDPSNVRMHPKRNLDAIEGSLRRFGQQKPVVALLDGTVVAGNGTLRAAARLGWKRIAAVRFSAEPGEAPAFGVADNRTAEIAEWSGRELMRLLAVGSRGGWAELGFDDEDFKRLEKMIDGPTPPDDFQEVGATIHTDYECPKCGYQWSGKTKGAG